MSEPRFYIISDDPVVAVLLLFGLTPRAWPEFLVPLSDPIAISSIPDGAKCRGMMFSGRERSAAERAWRARRGQGGIAFIGDEDEEWITAQLTAVEHEAPAAPLVRPEPELKKMPLSQRWT
ncbi:hypothetical protein [Rhizobium sp. Root483D2]|uniref:hypothetical protein n=1 Tax=Rhizobium sp. Root483D2 TaxID=1736545 RepID=UPI000715BF11|nr:hypothetical protein [Rhizobium sp. Root483D2]KQY20769.1 hypothetical protein ASD32_04970 [Rhizobium sp. Root483D2]